jgi:peptidoglycan/LPS O-acetylase OafA/YrhL
MPDPRLFGRVSASSDFSEPAAYRADLDGLRALAVLSVVFFHFRFPGFSGGFVGVDIFFVISGFLITSIIVGGLESETLSISHFYARRMRRIIPAFLVMLVAVTVAAIALFPPQELAEFGSSAAAAAAFLSNIYFAYHIDYFSEPDIMMPLLHTWSLGVEEQFYIIWPLLLFACYRIGSRFAVCVLVVTLVIVSLAYSQWGTTTNQSAHFYLLQSRAWELMLGAVLSLRLVPAINLRWLREGLAVLGIAMIAFAMTQFSPATPFPGLWATIPCVGALLVVCTGQQRDTAIYTILSLKPLIFVGLISYSLYLWHWPIFAFAENYADRSLSLSEALILVVVSIAIAAASWRYVEQPFRHSGEKTIRFQRATIVAGLGSLALATCLGLAIYLADGLPGRLAPDTLRFYLASRDHNPLRRDCLGGSGRKPHEASRCTVPAVKGNNGYHVVVWGDSHGDALFPAIAMIGQRYGRSTRQVTKRGCPPLVGVSPVESGRRLTRKDACAEYNSAVLRELQQIPRPSLVILTARWSMYTETGWESRRIFLIDAQHHKLDIETSREVLSRALAKTVDAITTLGIPVLLVGQPPELVESPGVCVVERALSQRDVSDCLRLPRRIAEDSLRPSNEILMKVASGRSAVTYISLDSFLCDDQVCRTEQNGMPLYEDDNHLNLWGARLVGRTLLQDPQVQSYFCGEACAPTH